MFETLEEYIKAFLKMPEMPLKSEWERIFNEMAVHTRKRLPKELLLARRPNEDKEIFEHRIKNYEPITYGSMNKCLDDVFRVVNSVNYSIKAKDETLNYIKENNIQFDGEELTLEMFIQKNYLKAMIEDPNGYLVWIPTGEGVEDSGSKVRPQPFIVNSSRIHYVDKNLISFLSDERSEVNNANQKEKTGLVYYIFTQNSYYKLSQFGEKTKLKFKLTEIYKHELGSVPAIKLGGDKNAYGYYESYFSPYLAFGNEAIRQFSDWQAVSTLSNHPLKEVFEAECEVDFINKLSNNIPDAERKFEKGVKQGKLKLRNKTASPYAVIQRKVVAKGQEQMEAVLPYEFPSVRFIQPNVENLKYSGESWEKLIERAELSLNIDLNVGVNQSGVSKEFDKEAQYSMLTKIGNNIFDNGFLMSVKIIEAYITPTSIDNTDVSIIKPTTFWVKNEQDIINEITELKTKNAPGFFTAQASIELAKKRFSGDPVSQKMFDFIACYDPLFIYSPAEKTQLLASGTVKTDDVSISTYMPTILNQMAVQLGAANFASMELTKMKEMFDTMVEPYLIEETTPLFDNPGNAE